MTKQNARLAQIEARIEELENGEWTDAADAELTALLRERKVLTTPRRAVERAMAKVELAEMRKRARAEEKMIARALRTLEGK